MSRAKNLDDEDIARIVGILDGWSGSLTWDALIDSIEKHLFVRYTRQALHKHVRIRDAFTLRKKTLSSEKPRSPKAASSPELELAWQRIDRLEAENKRLELENTRLLEQFVRWAYNANTRGLDANFLNQPLPPISRK